MPKVSRETATLVEEVGPVKDRSEIVEGYSVNFTVFQEEMDPTPLLKGLPDDRCQCPHWGYVFKGSLTVRVGDHEETYNAGDAFYNPPGHIPLGHEAGTEVIMFSPEEELRKTGRVVTKNAKAEEMHVRPLQRHT